MSEQSQPTLTKTAVSPLERGQQLIEQGRLRAAAEQLSQVIPAGGAPAAAAHFHLAQLYYEWNVLDTADAHLQQAATMREPDANARLAVAIQRLLARLYQIQGHTAAANAAIARANEFANTHHLVTQQRINTAHAAWLAIYRGDFTGAADCIVQLGNPTAVTHPDVFFTLLQWHILQYDHVTAREMLRSRPATRLRQRFSPALITLLVLEAIDAGSNGRPMLLDALTLARPEGYVRTFLDRGTLILPMLQAATDRPETAVYAQSLLKQFHQQPVAPTPPPPVPSPNDYPATTPLSAQELIVLRLLTHGKSYDDIAASLGIAAKEVRLLVRELYEKLEPQEHDHVEKDAPFPPETWDESLQRH